VNKGCLGACVAALVPGSMHLSGQGPLQRSCVCAPCSLLFFLDPFFFTDLSQVCEVGLCIAAVVEVRGCLLVVHALMGRVLNE
jgi:hypothetical protein